MSEYTTKQIEGINVFIDNTTGQTFLTKADLNKFYDAMAKKGEVTATKKKHAASASAASAASAFSAFSASAASAPAPAPKKKQAASDAAASAASAAAASATASAAAPAPKKKQAASAAANDTASATASAPAPTPKKKQAASAAAASAAAASATASASAAAPKKKQAASAAAAASAPLDFASAASGKITEYSPDEPEFDFEFNPEELDIDAQLLEILKMKKEDEEEAARKKQLEEEAFVKKRDLARSSAMESAKLKKLSDTLKENGFNTKDIQIYIEKFKKKSQTATHDAPQHDVQHDAPHVQHDAPHEHHRSQHHSAQRQYYDHKKQEETWTHVGRNHGPHAHTQKSKYEVLCTNDSCDGNSSCPYNHPNSPMCGFDSKENRCNRLKCFKNHHNGKAKYVKETSDAIMKLPASFGTYGNFSMETFEKGGEEKAYNPYNHYNEFVTIKRLDIDDIKHRCTHDIPWKTNEDGSPRRCFKHDCAWDHFAGHKEYCKK